MLDRAEASELPRRIADRMVADGVVERTVARIVDGPELERVVAAALDSPGMERLMVRRDGEQAARRDGRSVAGQRGAVAGRAGDRGQPSRHGCDRASEPRFRGSGRRWRARPLATCGCLARAGSAACPAPQAGRRAAAGPTAGSGMSRSALPARIHAGSPAPATTRRSTRVSSRAASRSPIDAALINLAALIVSVSVGLALSVLDPVEQRRERLRWRWPESPTWRGRSPTSSRSGPPPARRPATACCRSVCAARATARRSARASRCSGSGRWCSCALPLFAGFLPILVNNRRRGLHDIVAGSVVVSAPVAARRPVTG